MCGNLMKGSKIILFLFVFTSLMAQKTQLNNFAELMDALNTGENVRTVIYYGQCKLFSDGEQQEESVDATGGMAIGTYEYFSKMLFGNPNAFVVASETQLINHPHYGYVLNYGKIKIYDDSRVEINVKYLTPGTYEEQMDETFKSVISDGENQGAVYFYK